MDLSRRTLLLAAVVFIVGVVAMFPARVAYRWFVPEPVRLSGIGGTIWHGTATEGQVDRLYLAGLRWDVHASDLLRGRLMYDIGLDIGGGFLDGAAGVSLGGNVLLRNLSGGIAIGALQQVVASPGIDGNVRIDLDEVIASSEGPSVIRGTVDVTGLVARGLSPAPLGDFRAQFGTTPEGIVGSIEDVAAILDVAGSIRILPGRSYVLEGLVAPTAATPPAVVNQLRFLGSPNARGQREFRFEGQF